MNPNEKKLNKLDLIKKEKPHYYYAYTTVSCPTEFKIFLHLYCIEKYITFKPLERNTYNCQYNDTTPSLCIVYKNNEIITCLVSINFMELFEKIKKSAINDCIYQFYYIDLYYKDNDEYYLKKFKRIKQMIKRYQIVKNKL